MCIEGQIWVSSDTDFFLLLTQEKLRSKQGLALNLTVCFWQLLDLEKGALFFSVEQEKVCDILSFITFTQCSVLFNLYLSSGSASYKLCVICAVVELSFWDNQT